MVYAEALSRSPALAGDLESAHRYNGACAAALAGSGRGEDRESLDDGGRARWRQRAREWLRADLELVETQLGSESPDDRARIRGTFEHWQRDPGLAGVREEEALSKLPRDEAEEWRRLWKDVGRFLERVRAPKEVEEKP